MLLQSITSIYLFSIVCQAPKGCPLATGPSVLLPNSVTELGGGIATEFAPVAFLYKVSD